MKYMGSKGKIADEILPVILKDRVEGQFYIEPFVGGCNSIDKVGGKRIGLDVNPYLIALWKGLQTGIDKPMVIEKEPLYVEMREKFNQLKKEDPKIITNIVNNYFVENLTPEFKKIFTIGWVGFMASFNGRFYDGGYSGKTKTRDYVDEQIRNTLSQVENIRDIEFHCYSYDEFNYPSNSIIYCDIPYKDTKQYIYSKGFDHDKFWQWVREMTRMGHEVFVSEYNAPDDFECVWKKEVTNSLHPTKTKKPIEKLFTYKIKQ